MKTLAFESERRNLIWGGIVEYANADLSGGSATSAIASLQTAIKHCLSVSGNPTGRWEEIREVERYARDGGVALGDSLRFWAARYQAEFRNLLTWLCSPNENKQLGEGAARFMQENTQGIVRVFEYPYEDFDETGEHGIPVFFFRTVESCASIMSPLCDFISKQTESFEEGVLPLREAIPIRICFRPECGRFKLPERQREPCYCSDICRASHHQSLKAKNPRKDGR